MHVRRTMMLAALALTVLVPGRALAAPADAASASADTDWRYVGGQDPQTVYSSTRDEIAAGPSVGSVPAGGGWPAVLFYSWTTNPDVGSAGPDIKTERSTDGGKTFSAPVSTTSDFYSLARLPDGDILDVAFIPLSIASDKRTVTMRVSRSSDNGVTWTPVDSTFVLPETVPSFDRGLRVNPNILTDSHGWLYISYYTAYAGDAGDRAEIAVSKDEGRTWQRQGTILAPDSTLQYNEVGLSRTPNGDMMAVVAQDQVGTFSWRHTNKLVTERSADNGATWTGLRDLPISLDPGYSYRPDPSGVERYGILPDLELLKNGVMVLRYGRPDNWFAISTDGGQTFTHARTTFVNYPNATESGKAPFPYHGSSGNGTIAVIGPNTVVVSFDKCAAVYGCVPDNGEIDYDVNPPSDYAVYERTIVVTPPAR